MTEKEAAPDRALILSPEDQKNYKEFFADLFKRKEIISWTLVAIMQLFTLPEDLWLGEGVFLGSVICFRQGTDMKWAWVDPEWCYCICDACIDAQDQVLSNTLRNQFRGMTWGPLNEWQLLGDERIAFD